MKAGTAEYALEVQRCGDSVHCTMFPNSYREGMGVLVDDGHQCRDVTMATRPLAGEELWRRASGFLRCSWTSSRRVGAAHGP